MTFLVVFMDKVAVGQFSVLWFSCVIVILLPMLSTHFSFIFHWYHIIVAIEYCVRCYLHTRFFNASVRRSYKCKTYYKEYVIFRFIF